MRTDNDENQNGRKSKPLGTSVCQSKSCPINKFNNRNSHDIPELSSGLFQLQRAAHFIFEFQQEPNMQEILRILAPVGGKYTCCETTVSCGAPVLYRGIQHGAYTHIAIFLRAAWPACDITHVDYVKQRNAKSARKQEVESLSWNIALVKGKGTAMLPGAAEMLMTAAIVDRTCGYHPRYLAQLDKWQLPQHVSTLSNAPVAAFERSTSYVRCRISVETKTLAVNKSIISKLRRRLRVYHSSRIDMVAKNNAMKAWKSDGDICFRTKVWLCEASLPPLCCLCLEDMSTASGNVSDTARIRMVLKGDLSQGLQPIIEDVCGMNTISLCGRHVATKARPQKRPQNRGTVSGKTAKRRSLARTVTERQNPTNIQSQMGNVSTKKIQNPYHIQLQMGNVSTNIFCNDKRRSTGRDLVSV